MSNPPKTAFLHYTAPPVVGGVESVMLAHAHVFLEAGYPVTFFAGRGEQAALPSGVKLVIIPEMDSQNISILKANQELERGHIPRFFDALVESLVDQLAPLLVDFDHIIIHNIFTKHFNLPLTAALYKLLDTGVIRGCIAWCHDFTWTSPHSRSSLHPGHPWDLLRTYRDDVTYVVVSKFRQQELAELMECPLEEIRVIYNGVDPETLLGLSAEGHELIKRLGLLDSDLILLMPVRATQAKNIEYALQVTAALKEAGRSPMLVVTGPPDQHDEQGLAYFRSLQDLRDRLELQNEAHFVFETGLEAGEPYLIDARIVGDLYRVADVAFMPSYREGFGMPVLEAGLTSVPVVCTEVPAALEVGGDDILLFDPELEPAVLAKRIHFQAEENPVYQLRKRVRQHFTWQKIFKEDIEPLLLGDRE